MFRVEGNGGGPGHVVNKDHKRASEIEVFSSTGAWRDLLSDNVGESKIAN